MRNAIARIEVRVAGEVTSRGTGFLVTPDLVLTALHVVADRRPSPPRFFDGTLTLTFSGLSEPVPAKLVEGRWDRDADWALLQIERGVSVRPLPMAELDRSGCAWETHGFSDANPVDGLVFSGTVASHVATYGGQAAIQLFSEQAAAGNGAPVKGLSGGPCLVEGAVVGILRSSLMEDGKNVAGTLYATPIDRVLLACGSLLPSPDPHWGMPGLPSSDLPASPFRYLTPYEPKYAPVFFGRGRQIRALLGLTTSSDAAPVILAYGQSGVGKSSVLGAGLVPRLVATHHVISRRREAALGLAHQLADSLELPRGGVDAAAWRALEDAKGRPVVAILDQVEEVFTRPSPDGPAELDQLLLLAHAVFGNPATRPRGRLILSFRKEWLAEVEARAEKLQVPTIKYFIERMTEEDVAEAVQGLTLSARLRMHYGLAVEDGLAARIAQDVLEDPASPAAAMLQILLTRMWTIATEENRSAPRFTHALYTRLRQGGLGVRDFLDQQLAALRAEAPKVIESGLVLDLLWFHTTELGTAEERSEAVLLERYRHLAASVPPVVRQLQDRYLLADAAEDDAKKAKATRLAHDTLAPFVRQEAARSTSPGAVARRLLDDRGVGWQNGQSGDLFDDRDLAAVERGLPGTRAPSADEERLLEASRAARAGRRRQRTVLFGALALAITLAIGLGIQSTRRQHEVDAQRLVLEDRLAAMAHSGAELETEERHDVVRGLVAAGTAVRASRAEDRRRASYVSHLLELALRRPDVLVPIEHASDVDVALLTPDLVRSWIWTGGGARFFADLATGTEAASKLSSGPGHPEGPSKNADLAALSRDGELVAWVEEASTLVLASVREGIKYRLELHSVIPEAVQSAGDVPLFNPDMQTLGEPWDRTGLTFSSDGRYLVMTGGGRIWAIPTAPAKVAAITWNPIRTLSLPGALPIFSLANGPTIAPEVVPAGGGRWSVRVLNVETLEPIDPTVPAAVLEGPPESMAFVDGGRRLAVVVQRRTRPNEVLCTTSWDHEGSTRWTEVCVADPNAEVDGARPDRVHELRYLAVRAAEGGDDVRGLSTDPLIIRDVSADGRRVLTEVGGVLAGADRPVRVWSVGEEGYVRITLPGDAHGRLLQFAADELAVAVSAHDELRFASTTSGEAIGAPVRMPSPVRGVALAADRRSVGVITRDGSFLRFGLPRVRRAQTIARPAWPKEAGDSFEARALSRDGRLMAAARAVRGRGLVVDYLEVATGRRAWASPVSLEDPTVSAGVGALGLALSNDGSRLFVAAGERAFVLEASSGRSLATLSNKSGSRFAAVGFAGHELVAEIMEGSARRLARFGPEGGASRSECALPGEVEVSGFAFEGAVAILGTSAYATSNCAQLASWTVDEVTPIFASTAWEATSRMGPGLAAAPGDRPLAALDVVRLLGAPAVPPEADEEREVVTFSPDGRFFVTRSVRRINPFLTSPEQLRVWDSVSGSPLTAPIPSESLELVAFTAQGDLVLAESPRAGAQDGGKLHVMSVVFPETEKVPWLDETQSEALSLGTLSVGGRSLMIRPVDQQRALAESFVASLGASLAAGDRRAAFLALHLDDVRGAILRDLVHHPEWCARASSPEASGDLRTLCAMTR